VHIDGYDEALCTPTELSAITALRTNQILQLETRVTHTIDPLGGSYFVESLTNQLEDKIESVLSEIDRMGGLVNATESGWVHREISNSAYDYQRKVESGEIPIVGVNCSRQEDEELPIELFEVPETLSIQEKKLAEIMKKRDASKVGRAIDDIARCCDEDRNLMEVIVDAVKALVSEGEISRTIKGCYGTWDVPLF
jgi:methylmalonyl-CoA mutase N-terminal domain/subunit